MTIPLSPSSSLEKEKKTCIHKANLVVRFPLPFTGDLRVVLARERRGSLVPPSLGQGWWEVWWGLERSRVWLSQLFEGPSETCSFVCIQGREHPPVCGFQRCNGSAWKECVSQALQERWGLSAPQFGSKWTQSSHLPGTKSKKPRNKKVICSFKIKAKSQSCSYISDTAWYLV